MVTDPRFDVQPDDYTETQKRRSKWTSRLIGCLIVAGVAMIVMIFVAVWVGRNWRGWAADFGTQALDQGLASADLPPHQLNGGAESANQAGSPSKDGFLV